MATKVKPSRLQVSGTPQVGQVPVYVDEDTFSWGAGGGNGDAKTFSLSSTSDLTTAQDAYDWYKSGKTPVVRYNSGDYLVEFADSSKAILCSTGYHKETETSYNGRTQNNLIFNLSSDTVTSIDTSYGGTFTMYYLSPAVNYATPYTPQYDGSPATKKYVDDKVSDTAYANSWDGVTGIAPSKNAVYDKINSIDALIPSAATSSNKLTDKNYVDDSINQVAAYYITKNAQGDAFSTHAELFATTTFYSGGATRTPTRNDYCIILADETHSGACTRYTYQGTQWEYQYTVNESPMSQAQLDALNSGITAAKVSTYDGYASDIADKQDELVSGVNIRTINGTSILGSGDITTPAGGDVYGPASSTDGNIVLFNGATGKSIKDGSKSISDFVQTSGNQTIAGTKTFSTSPVVPNKTADATNTGTAIATEAQVYKKQDTLVSGTNIKTINSNSLLGSGNISLNEVPSGGTDGQVLSKVSGSVAWANPSGGDVMVSSQSGNILTSGMKIWAGTEADYGNLGTYDSNTLYLTV